MSRIADAEFTGKSGSYSFGVYPWGTDFTAIGAVYVITKRTADADTKGTHHFIYLGQTADLSERFDNHHKASCFTKNGANCICIHLEGNEKTRLAIESDLIAGNDTPCNG